MTWPASHHALMDMTPPRFRINPQQHGYRVVGLLVVGTGVPVQRIIGTGNPTTRQTQTQRNPGIPAGKALRTARGIHPDLVGSSYMPTLTPIGTAYPMAANSRHCGPPSQPSRARVMDTTIQPR